MTDILNKIIKCRRTDNYEDLDSHNDGLNRIIPAVAMPPSVADSGSLFQRRVSKKDGRSGDAVPEGSLVQNYFQSCLCVFKLVPLNTTVHRNRPQQTILQPK